MVAQLVETATRGAIRRERSAEGALAPGRFAVGESAQDANDRLIYDEATGKLFFDADGRGAGVQILIATLADMPILMASDFVVV